MSTKIKGSSIKARLEHLKSKYGEKTLDSVLDRLNDEDQKQLRGIVIAISQYPIELNARLDEAIAKELDPHNEISVYRELGKASAEANLNSIHKTFIQGNDPHDVLRRYPSVRKQYYSDGTAEYQKTDEKRGELKLQDATFTLQDDESTAGYFERGIELMGGKNVEVRVVSTSNTCTYYFSWD